MRKNVWFFCVLISIMLLISIIFLLRVSFEADVCHGTLEKIYFIGGTVSGIFAFLAFFVAVISNYSQIKTGKRQRFETTFFNMLNLQQQIVSDLSFKDNNNGQTSEGRDMFHFTFKIRDHYFNNEKQVKGMSGLLESKGLVGYTANYTPDYFDHYFRHLYTIVKFVDKTDFLSFNDKYRYISMVRATLSRYELVWIYYNCLTEKGKEKFKPLIEKYSFLKNIRPDLLALCKENKDILIDKKLESIPNKFSGSDYEFFLTAKDDDREKYYIGAFFNKENLQEGLDRIAAWDKFIS